MTRCNKTYQKSFLIIDFLFDCFVNSLSEMIQALFFCFFLRFFFFFFFFAFIAACPCAQEYLI